VAGGAHAAPAGPARSQRDDVDSAMTTSVQAQGKSSPDQATCLCRMAGFLARGVRCQGTGGTLSPSRAGFAKGGRFVEIEASNPGLSQKSPVAFPMVRRRLAGVAPCRPARRRFHRPIVPRHSTVAGSAVIAAPGLGPPCHVPFSPGPVCGRREPSDGRMIKRAPPPSQSSGRHKEPLRPGLNSRG